MTLQRLAIVTTHPIQYYAPWFRYLAQVAGLDLKVFYLWDGGAEARHDAGFGQSVRWDVPLLEGYAHEFVPNESRQPAADHFSGLRNRTLRNRLAEFSPGAALLLGYNYPSFLRLIFDRWPWPPPFPLLFRGDSHRLFPRPESLRERLRHSTIAAIYRRFAACLYVGQANRDYFLAHGVPAERLFFSPHAVDNARFAAEPELTARAASAWRLALGVPPDRVVVMFAGKFEDKKRPLDLLQAFQQLGKDHYAALVFVGAGRLEESMRSRAAGTPHVYFAPFQNQSQMPRTYAAADLVVLPSYGSGETWGLAINEALCVGRPVIVSDHVGCAKDLVTPGRNGLVFPAGNIAALSAALREALSDRERLAHWGEAGREIVHAYDYSNASRGLFTALKFLGRSGVESA